MYKVITILLTLVTLPAAANPSILDEKPLRSVVKELIKNKAYTRQELEQIFANFERLPKVVERMKKPAEALPWHRYRNIFVKDKRIEQGMAFWNQHADTLNRAESKYGVPAKIIVAIIGVETRFGRHKGGFRVLDSLTTLALDYPRRSKFFAKELKEFLLLCREEGFDPLAIVGSYAGAMGKPQFIASSYRMYAVDFDGDGKRDLLGSTADAIGSVANYLARHGWKRNQPIATPVKVNGSHYHKLVKKGLKPHTPLSDLARQGIQPGEQVAQSHKAALIELEQQQSKEYWAGLQNFYAITRYNHSALYAMAVYQLGSAIRDRRQNVSVSN